MPGEWGYHLEPAIQDVIVIAARGETVPDGFLLIDKTLNTRKFATKVCPRHAPLQWGCDLPFRAAVLGRFPQRNTRPSRCRSPSCPCSPSRRACG